MGRGPHREGCLQSVCTEKVLLLGVGIDQHIPVHRQLRGGTLQLTACRGMRWNSAPSQLRWHSTGSLVCLPAHSAGPHGMFCTLRLGACNPPSQEHTQSGISQPATQGS